MKEEQNKKFDNLSKKMFKEAGLQSPDSNFEFKVMQQIEQLPIPGSVLAYKKPFDKTILPIAFVVFIGSMLGILLFGREDSYGLVDKIPEVSFDAIAVPELGIPKTVVFAMLALMVLVFAQVPIVKSAIGNK